MLTLVSPSSVVPPEHPLRQIKERADAALREMSELFDEMYAGTGRPSIPPEVLLKSQLLIALYSVRSERQFCEQVRYNLLFRWFLDINLDTEPFSVSVFTKNRDRLLRHDVCGLFFKSVVEQARRAKLLSDEHFSVDGSLIQAWASIKSFEPKDSGNDDTKPGPGGNSQQRRKARRADRNAWKDFKGTKRSNETHHSTTDPEARLARKGNNQGAHLSFSMHSLMENRNGLLAGLHVDLATGTAERDMAETMLRGIKGSHRITVGADRGYDTRDFVAGCRDAGVTPHIAQNVARPGGSAIDKRTTRTNGYKVSQRSRMFIESIFGWLKDRAGLRRTRFKGRARTELYVQMAGAAYNLLRMAKLAPV
jgi:transposase